MICFHKIYIIKYIVCSSWEREEKAEIYWQVVSRLILSERILHGPIPYENMKGKKQPLK